MANQRPSFLKQVELVHNLFNPLCLDAKNAKVWSSIVRLLTCFVVMGLVFYFIQSNLFKESYIYRFPPLMNYYRVAFITNYGSCIFILGNCMWMYKESRKVVKMVASVDKFLSLAPPYQVKNTFWRNVLIKYTIYIGLYVIPLSWGSTPDSGRAWLLVFASKVMVILCDCCIKKFSIFVSCILIRFIVLEKLLKKVWKSRAKGWQQTVLIIIEANGVLSDACYIWNKYWSVSLALITLSVYMSLVRGAVTLCLAILKGHGHGAYEYSILTLYFWLWNLYDLTHYNQLCETQVDRFNITLYCLAMKDLDIRNEKPEFLDTLQIEIGRKRRVEFHAHGFFLLNNNCVHMILTGVFTTVVLILQTNT